MKSPRSSSSLSWQQLLKFVMVHYSVNFVLRIVFDSGLLRGFAACLRQLILGLSLAACGQVSRSFRLSLFAHHARQVNSTFGGFGHAGLRLLWRLTEHSAKESAENVGLGCAQKLLGIDGITAQIDELLGLLAFGLLPMPLVIHLTLCSMSAITSFISTMSLRSSSLSEGDADVAISTSFP